MFSLKPRFLAHFSVRALSAGLILGLVACEDVSGVRVLATPVPPATQDRPATPPPQTLTTPKPPAASQQVATPVPSRPPASAVPMSPRPNLTPVPTGSASPSPVPGASGEPFQKTGQATDLAVSGTAYFVLATKPNPTRLEDLLFTRSGHFALVADSAGTLSLLRLQHADTGFHAVGFLTPGGTGAGAPDETRGTDAGVLTTTWDGTEAVALGLFLDAERNPDAPAKVTFDYTGRMEVAGTSPRGEGGQPVQLYVALAGFTDATKLTPQPGFVGVYRYAAAAGPISLGVAVSGAERPLGNDNLILTGTLARPETKESTAP